jgi:hypothetical protein
MIHATLALALAAVVSPAGTGTEQCGVCHPTERVDFQRSVHARENISCADCHGGDPFSVDVEQAHRGSFLDMADRRRIPGMCAECHSDSSMMRPYNLPTEQYVIYQTSEHGLALSRGERRAAVCSDCHDAHDVLPPSHPESSVHPRNIPATCASCHSDETLMEQFGIDSHVVEDYLSGVHGQALVLAGNSAAPDCSRCHGVHGAVPPGVGDIEKVCGSCHMQVRSAFREGPHYEGMREAGLAECASCHENHATRRHEIADLDTMCDRCHAEQSDELLSGAKLRSMIEAAEQEIQKAELLVDEAEQIPLDMEDHRARIIQARTYLRELPTATHALSIEAVEMHARRARSVGEEVQHDVYSKLQQLTARRIGLAAFWFYILMTVAILVAYKRSLRRDEKAP